MPAPGNERGQMLLAEEYFATENNAFVETLRRANQPKALAALTDRWRKDPRPWARQQMFAYLAQPFDIFGHQPVIKRLFKQAEENKDHELMAVFLVAFDRQVRRRLRTKRRWDFESRSVTEEEKLVTPRDVIPSKSGRTGRNPATGEEISYYVRTPAHGRLFSYRTRYYLRRRVWRYFRHLGHRDPDAYLSAVVRALTAYRDDDLQRGENILDSWGLLHACFAGHDALEFGATHIRLKDGRSLGELSPAPQFPDFWRRPEAAPLLLALVFQAPARLVRLWAMQLYQREHAAHAVPLETIVRLLEHDEADVQQFGAKLLETSASLGTLPVAAWLKLLQTRNEDALQRICDAFAKNVTGDRLDFAQCLELAGVRPVPVARLGQRYLRERVISTPADREQLTALANAQCPAVASELTAWALGILGTKEHYSADQVIRFFDSRLAETRAAAWTWLVADSPGLADPALWSRLTETPYDDLRLRVVDFLQRQMSVGAAGAGGTETRGLGGPRSESLPGVDAGKLESVWRSVLLGVHRGGRQKAKAVQQIARAIVEDPDRGDALLPVLAVAVRSVRGPEARAGLAAVASVVEARPQLAAAVRRHLPEVRLEVEVAQ